MSTSAATSGSRYSCAAASSSGPPVTPRSTNPTKLGHACVLSLHLRCRGEGVVVGERLGGRAGADHADPAGGAGGDRAPGGREDHLDHGHVVAFPRIAQHRGTGGVAGDHQRLDPLVDEVVEALEGVLADLTDRLGTVGLTRGVAEVHDRLVGQLVDHGPGDGQTTEARVEDPDRRIRHTEQASRQRPGERVNATELTRARDRPARDWLRRTSSILTGVCPTFEVHRPKISAVLVGMGHMNRGRTTLTAVAVAGALVAAGAAASPAAGATHKRRVARTSPTWVSHTKSVGNAPAKTRSTFRVYLAPQGGTAALQAAVLRVSDPKSSSVRALPERGPVPRDVRPDRAVGRLGPDLAQAEQPQGHRHRRAQSLPVRRRHQRGRREGVLDPDEEVPPRRAHRAGQRQRGCRAGRHRLRDPDRHRPGHLPAPGAAQRPTAAPELPQRSPLLALLRPGGGQHAGRPQDAAAQVPGQDAAVRRVRLHRSAVPRGLREQLEVRRQRRDRGRRRRLRLPHLEGGRAAVRHQPR